jgi:hypothetical protein
MGPLPIDLHEDHQVRALSADRSTFQSARDSIDIWEFSMKNFSKSNFSAP